MLYSLGWFFIYVLVAAKQITSLASNAYLGPYGGMFVKFPFRSLAVKSISTKRVPNEMHCSMNCQRNDICFSFNFAATNDSVGNFVCELLSKSHLYKLKNFKTNDSFHHFGRKDFCSPNVKGLPSPDSDNTYTCPCKEGYTGLRCETDIDECASSPCVHGKCKDMVNAYKCNCNPGYTGVNCETDINECQSNPCVNGTCEDKVNSYKCNCIPGFTGTNCEQDIDECSSNPCKNAGICSNLVDAYNCTCASRYHGTNCENKLGPCDVNPCANGGTCTELSDENFECACLPGHYWSKCEFHAYASNDYKTADDADKDCKNRGMALAMIFQSSVNKILKGLHQSDFWIGLKKVNGLWKWPNGTELDENVYSKWNSQIGSNNCVKMDPSNGKWKSDPCTNSRPFVCTSYEA